MLIPMNGWIDVAIYSCLEVFENTFDEAKYKAWAESNYRAACGWYGYYLMARHYNKKTDMQVFYDKWCVEIAEGRNPEYSAGILEKNFEAFWVKIKTIIRNDTH